MHVLQVFTPMNLPTCTLCGFVECEIEVRAAKSSEDSNEVLVGVLDGPVDPGCIRWCGMVFDAACLAERMDLLVL